MFITVIQRELRLAWRKRADILNPLWFFLITITLFPLSVGADPPLLARIAPGVLWISALLASLLALERLFDKDFADGSLEQLLLLPYPLPLLVLAKVGTHWLTTGVPLLLLSPLIALLLSLDPATWQAAALTLLLGTPTLSLIGAIGAALTVALRQGGVLLGLLVLPLYIPLLIFACTAIDAAAQQQAISGFLALMGAMLLAALMFAPLAIAAALRISLG